VNSEKDRAAQKVIDAKADFDMALSKRKYPLDEFRVFVRAARRYIGLTAGDPLIHRKVAGEISGLADYLKLERKRVPGDVLYEADRLHAYCSPATIRTSRVTNRRIYDGGRFPGPKRSIFRKSDSTGPIDLRCAVSRELSRMQHGFRMAPLSAW
jgi:hypothetical protein